MSHLPSDHRHLLSLPGSPGGLPWACGSEPHDSFSCFFSDKYPYLHVSLPPAQENSIYSSDWEKLTQNEHVLSFRAQLLKLKIFTSQNFVSDLNFQKTSLETLKLCCEMQALTLLCVWYIQYTPDGAPQGWGAVKIKGCLEVLWTKNL